MIIGVMMLVTVLVAVFFFTYGYFCGKSDSLNQLKEHIAKYETDNDHIKLLELNGLREAAKLLGSKSSIPDHEKYQ